MPTLVTTANASAPATAKTVQAPASRASRASRSTTRSRSVAGGATSVTVGLTTVFSTLSMPPSSPGIEANAPTGRTISQQADHRRTATYTRVVRPNTGVVRCCSWEFGLGHLPTGGANESGGWAWRREKGAMSSRTRTLRMHW
jgi:hypothetical protein